MPSIDDIKRLLESNRTNLGMVDEAEMFEWIHPKDIHGLDEAELHRNNLDTPLSERCDDDFLSDDDCIQDYLEYAVDNRISLKKPIPTVWLLEALLFLSKNYGSSFPVTQFPREKMSEDELGQGLTVFKNAVLASENPKIRGKIVERMFVFFCFNFISPEIDTLPVLKEFVSRSDVKSVLFDMEEFL